MARVHMKNVTKVFSGSVEAVKDFSLEVKDREFVVFVGPSGSGKSTALRMIAGLEEITEGEIYIDDRLINDVPSKDRDIAMVFQSYALYPHMKIYDNLAFGLKLRKYPKEEIDRRVKETAQILGIEHLLERIPKALSGGQQQRVALGRAIVRKPKVFLFDEPLSNLDAKLRVQMRIEIIKLHQRLQTTAIYVTHDQVEAMTMGERIVVLKDGLIQQVDAPLTLYHKPLNKFVASFIGSPPMNFFEGKILKKDNSFYFAGDAIEIPLDAKTSTKIAPYINKEVFLGIRPESIEISNEKGFSAVLEVTEPLGNEILLHFSVSNVGFLASQTSFSLTKHNSGDKVKVLFPPERLYFFDKISEEVIT
ncbi:MAG: sn-glycerol-3-phosphate ABC transporter ATP-binding protein UgpC [bacterium]